MRKGFPFVLFSPLQIIVDIFHRNFTPHCTINCALYANIHYTELKAYILIRPRIII